MKSWVRYYYECVDIRPKQGMLAMPVDSSLHDGVYVVKHAHGRYVDLAWYRRNSLSMLKRNLQIWMKMIFGLAKE